jgi:hypothetical protein
MVRLGKIDDTDGRASLMQDRRECDPYLPVASSTTRVAAGATPVAATRARSAWWPAAVCTQVNGGAAGPVADVCQTVVASAAAPSIPTNRASGSAMTVPLATRRSRTRTCVPCGVIRWARDPWSRPRDTVQRRTTAGAVGCTLHSAVKAARISGHTPPRWNDTYNI